MSSEYLKFSKTLPKKYPENFTFAKLCLETYENDRLEYESKIADSRCTDGLQSFIKSKTPTTKFCLNKQAIDPCAQAELFSENVASSFVNSILQSILPRTTNTDTLDNFDASEDFIKIHCCSLKRLPNAISSKINNQSVVTSFV